MRKPALALLCLLTLLLAGCAGLTLPEVNLDAPGWETWIGQALWKPAADRPSLAGELIVARRTSGEVLVSFSKPPFPIFTAQTSAAAWRLDFVERGRSYSGQGRPPKRFVWFRLPALLADAEAPRGWQVEHPAADEWTLEHEGRGEVIRIVLDSVPSETAETAEGEP